MFQFDVNEGFIVRQTQALEAALTSNPEVEKRLRKLIREFVLDARNQVVNSIKFKHGDPRDAAQAVRTVVYERILGANINIYSSRKAHGQNNYEPPRKGSTGRGGNRRARSLRTQQVMGYAPLDRGFILRWQNTGTGDRNIRFTPNDRRKVDKWNKHPNTGSRGSVAAMHFFRKYGEPAMRWMEENLAPAIETELAKILESKK